MKRALEAGDIVTESTAPIESGKPDARYNPEPPEGGLILRVHSKVLGGYEETDNRWEQIFQSALGRDNLWITRDEHAALVDGDLPDTLMMRLARFHLTDNTRGEPPMWRPDEIRSSNWTLKRASSRERSILRLMTANAATVHRSMESWKQMRARSPGSISWPTVFSRELVATPESHRRVSFRSRFPLLWRMERTLPMPFHHRVRAAGSTAICASGTSPRRWFPRLDRSDRVETTYRLEFAPARRSDASGIGCLRRSCRLQTFGRPAQG